jgi:hypothetical protein
MMWIVLLGGILLFFSFKISFQRNPEFHVLIRDFLFHSPAVAVIANLVGAGLMYLSMVIYAGRKSYLA